VGAILHHSWKIPIYRDRGSFREVLEEQKTGKITDLIVPKNFQIYSLFPSMSMSKRHADW